MIGHYVRWVLLKTLKQADFFAICILHLSNQHLQGDGQDAIW